MTCIISAFSTFLVMGYGAVLAIKWMVRIVQNNREEIFRVVYNAYNLPDATYQRVKVRVNRNLF